MKTRLLSIVLIIAIASVSALSLGQDVTEPVHMTTGVVQTHPSQGDVTVVEGASATLFTTEDGATMIYHTPGLEPNHVYTAWVVIMNDPEACETSPCTATDIIAGTEATQSEVVYGDGIIADADGVGNFAGHVRVGDVPGGWMGHGYTNAQGAEILVVINDHGLLIPERAANMINSYRGGCTDESLPPPFPDTAKADGEPGPNTCRLIQAVTFQQ